MAGGIDWFRWHHGTAGDRKFPLVAKRAGARVGDVITMWAILLEQASANDERGAPGNVDFEAIDLALDMPDGMAEAIYTAMVARGLIDSGTGRLIAWDKRQPKRERPEDNSTERSRAHRAKQRQATPEGGDATPKTDGATPRNASESTETPREEERREEETGASAPAAQATSAGAVCLALKAAGIGSVSPHNQRLHSLIDAGAQPGEFTAFAARALEVAPARAFEYVLGAVEGERIRAASTAGRLRRGAIPTSKQSAIEAHNAAIVAAALEEDHATE